MKMIVIADDFTGANDTGVQLAKKGARTEVMLSAAQKPSRRADVLVVNTESRALPAEQAAQAVRQVLEPYCRDAENMPLIYKKIDSTLRGNVGAEVEAAMTACGARLAIVAAAIPAAGRITRAGECLVNGVPLLETEFASDPKTPIVSSRISTLLERQTSLPVHEIALESVRDGTLGARLAACAAGGLAMVVLDAENDNDLALIAVAADVLSEPFLWVGAAGLANALPAKHYLRSGAALPVLVVAGSMSEATRRQVAFVLREKLADVVDIDADELLTGNGERIVREASEILNRGRHCILRTSRSEEDRHVIDDLCASHGMSRQALGETLSGRLGEITLRITGCSNIGGLFLTGGDIAIAVANALGAEGYRILSEVAPCIPCGTLVNSEVDDLPVITKAGGFGGETTLRDALYFIEEMYSEH
ncbi:D-threonate kinase [Enterobacillus tribolii]|uniref:Uncharacterized protein YgbK (DUF1537 family) n=1 Tax=Enterobacillus tribolii TaxID=1487935 RepID=A0A370R1S1_9GAMM|nr:four-carbon acid sugar kinase family protein [Enterobacillus tribolii]MBW7983016.1 four-carbon acid sugar kinase family protein [Enterobacillus tribolii]RDK95880.1 uncharacterized protein YgbK (DUF1537 family) [Enterobacillus tribolii]